MVVVVVRSRNLQPTPPKTFAQQTPVLKPSPLLDGSDVWKVPRDEVLYVDVELEPSFRLPTDKGSRGLAAMIKCCLTDEERLQLIQTAGKGFSRREAQDILDACAPSSGHLDATTIYKLCKALAPSISTGCASFLAQNLTERQHLTTMRARAALEYVCRDGRWPLRV